MRYCKFNIKSTIKSGQIKSPYYRDIKQFYIQFSRNIDLISSLRWYWNKQFFFFFCCLGNDQKRPRLFDKKFIYIYYIIIKILIFKNAILNKVRIKIYLNTYIIYPGFIPDVFRFNIFGTLNWKMWKILFKSNVFDYLHLPSIRKVTWRNFFIIFTMPKNPPLPPLIKLHCRKLNSFLCLFKITIIKKKKS